METPRTTQPGWQDLFHTNSPTGTVVRWRVLRRRGEPLLVLPESNGAAAQSLTLYPAQTMKARLVRNVLRAALRLNLPLPLVRAEVRVDAAAPFAMFLSAQAGVKHFPACGILCGNPHTAGRRFVLLLFGEHYAPVCVVKAGMGKTAMALIEREINFLATVPTGVMGIPKLSGTWRGENVSALAQEFLDGEFSPTADNGLVPKLMNAWVVEGEGQPLATTAPWRELEPVFAATPSWQRLAELGRRTVRRVIWHGDFTPWNLKRDHRTEQCVALDWERGQLSGVPGWDWFHFVIQSAVLVKKLSGVALREEFAALLESEHFSTYAARCGVAGCERELALAYLLYNVDVLQPSEGRAEIRALLEHLTDSWRNN
jgi:hypothetical protein